MPDPDITATSRAIARSPLDLARPRAGRIEEPAARPRRRSSPSATQLLEAGALDPRRGRRHAGSSAPTSRPTRRATRRDDLLGADRRDLRRARLRASTPRAWWPRWTAGGRWRCSRSASRPASTRPTKLQVRVFPDQLHIDAHDPALTADETTAAQWYWDAALARRTRRPRGRDGAAWRGLTSKFRPGRAAYLVQAMTPTNTPGRRRPGLPRRARARVDAGAGRRWPPRCPDRFCVVGLRERQGGDWVERFRRWGSVRARPARGRAGPAQPGGGRDRGRPARSTRAPRWLRDPTRPPSRAS